MRMCNRVFVCIYICAFVLFKQRSREYGHMTFHIGSTIHALAHYISMPFLLDSLKLLVAVLRATNN